MLSPLPPGRTPPAFTGTASNDRFEPGNLGVVVVRRGGRDAPPLLTVQFRDDEEHHALAAWFLAEQWMHAREPG